MIQLFLTKAVPCICTLILTTVIQPLNGISTVLQCRFRERDWTIRKMIFNCTESHGLTYHCLLDYSDNPVEVCLKRKEYRGEGCPWVLQLYGASFFGQPLTSCENKRYCPSEGERFYSNQLYLYPACLVNTEDRMNFTLADKIVFPYMTKSSANPHQNYQRNETFFKTSFFAVLGFIVILISRIT